MSEKEKFNAMLKYGNKNGMTTDEALKDLPSIKPDTCEGCQDPCIMFESKMKACEDKE